MDKAVNRCSERLWRPSNQEYLSESVAKNAQQNYASVHIKYLMITFVVLSGNVTEVQISGRDNSTLVSGCVFLTKTVTLSCSLSI